MKKAVDILRRKYNTSEDDLELIEKLESREYHIAIKRYNKHGEEYVFSFNDYIVFVISLYFVYIEHLKTTTATRRRRRRRIRATTTTITAAAAKLLPKMPPLLTISTKGSRYSHPWTGSKASLLVAVIMASLILSKLKCAANVVV